MSRDRAYLQDIIGAGNRIVLKVKGISLADFLVNEDLQDIVMRQITIMGEAAKLVSEETKERFAEIPWYKIWGMRNRLVHEYRDIDYEEVWKTAKNDVPQVVKQMNKIISPL